MDRHPLSPWLLPSCSPGQGPLMRPRHPCRRSRRAAARCRAMHVQHFEPPSRTAATRSPARRAASRPSPRSAPPPLAASCLLPAPLQPRRPPARWTPPSPPPPLPPRLVRRATYFHPTRARRVVTTLRGRCAPTSARRMNAPRGAHAALRRARRGAAPALLRPAGRSSRAARRRAFPHSAPDSPLKKTKIANGQHQARV